MLYHLFRWLNEEHGFPYLVRYPSFRIAAAFATALFLCIGLGPRFIAWLGRRGLSENLHKMGKARRAIVPEGKAGTPTMGGLLTGAAVLIAALLWCPLDRGLVWGGIAAFTGAGAVGLWDDRVKLLHPTRHGISFRAKLALLTLLSLGLGVLLQRVVWASDPDLQVLVLPFVKHAVDLAWLGGAPLVVLVVLAICGSSNAVNLTDGMDGLAAGCLAIAGLAFTVLAYTAGSVELAASFFLPFVPDAQEVAVLVSALVGAALGFLWFNAAPAQVFMGDVGSLSFGALLGYAAIACRMEIMLLVAGGIFVAEAGSVMIQVGSVKLRGKRVFLCSPVHHHFQKQKIPETKIVVRFWCVAIVLAACSVALLKVR